ncbi:MAG: hypothetical protein EPN82_00715 [Bacteroidetes bacterium]|nr:MAG: hypothetical protein EPN82_00715 [Bacteroidota bacterium]
MKTKLFLLIISLIISIGCQDNSTNTNNSNYIIPLALGNYWVYRNDGYDTLGQYHGSYNDTLKIVSEDNIKIGKIYGFINGDLITECMNKSDGFYFIYDYSPQPIESTMVFKYPGFAGEIFNSNFGIANIESTDTLVEVPAGKFHCYKYKINRSFSDRMTQEIYYISPGIGEIYIETLLTYSDNKLDLDLVSKKFLVEYKTN